MILKNIENVGLHHPQPHRFTEGRWIKGMRFQKLKNFADQEFRN